MARRGRDAGAFRAFYRAHYGLILTVAEQRLDSPEAAEDAVSETFQVAWRRYTGGAELTLPWLYQILRNVIGSEYRRLARSRRANKRLGDDKMVADPPDDTKIDARAALRQLPERDREVLYMAYWEDLTSEEMAGILGTSRGAVRVRLTRAREKLRMIFAEHSAVRGE